MRPTGRSEVPNEAPSGGSSNGKAAEPGAALEGLLPHQECALPRRGPGRALLKRLYYSWAFRSILYGPFDLVEGLLGRRDPLMPPRRLQYVGRGDFNALGAQLRDRLIQDHGLEPSTDFLDVGCGVGRVAVALVPTLDTGTYHGFDIVPAGIAWCRRAIASRYPNFSFDLADVRNRQYNPDGHVSASEYRFPYESAMFDLAVASSVFTHMRPDDTRRYLSEAARVLRPGGRLVCEFFLLDPVAVALLADGRTAFALDHEFTDRSGTAFLGSDPRVPEYNAALYEADLRLMAEEAGLEIERIEFGRWTGRQGGPEGRFQDLVALVKPT